MYPGCLTHRITCPRFQEGGKRCSPRYPGFNNSKTAVIFGYCVPLRRIIERELILAFPSDSILKMEYFFSVDTSESLGTEVKWHIGVRFGWYTSQWATATTRNGIISPRRFRACVQQQYNNLQSNDSFGNKKSNFL